MSPTADSGNGSSAAAPTLPPNVCIFAPADAGAVKALLGGRIFTRLVVSAATEPADLAAALQGRPEIGDAYCLRHRNVVLLFDGGAEEDEGFEDAHHEHFRLVCLALKDRNIGLDVAGCVFDAPDVLQAGFQLDELSGGAVLVIDLMGGDDDDSDSDSDDDDSAAQTFLMGGDSNTTMS
jgi:hypothetical protein